MYRKDDKQWWAQVLLQKSRSLSWGIEDTECLAAFLQCTMGERERAGRFEEYERLLNEKFLEPYFSPEKQCYNFSGIYMSEVIKDKENVYWECLDNLAPHLLDTENWDVEKQSRLNEGLQDGTYIFGDVRLSPGDVVIDAGANLGFFSAYASHKRCQVHAFEPDQHNRECLQQTAALNNDIFIHAQALMDRTGKTRFLADGSYRSTIAFLDKTEANVTEVEALTIDAFVNEKAFPRVDFIKADVEGAERLLIKGAFQTLRKMSPKLSICTYHYPDDPQILEQLIMEANSRYTVVQGRKKLYALVKE